MWNNFKETEQLWQIVYQTLLVPNQNQPHFVIHVLLRRSLAKLRSQRCPLINESDSYYVGTTLHAISALIILVTSALWLNTVVIIEFLACMGIERVKRRALKSMDCVINLNAELLMLIIVPLMLAIDFTCVVMIELITLPR